MSYHIISYLFNFRNTLYVAYSIAKEKLWCEAVPARSGAKLQTVVLQRCPRRKHKWIFFLSRRVQKCAEFGGLGFSFDFRRAFSVRRSEQKTGLIATVPYRHATADPGKGTSLKWSGLCSSTPPKNFRSRFSGAEVQGAAPEHPLAIRQATTSGFDIGEIAPYGGSCC